MNLTDFTFQSFRVLLFPFSVLYAGVIRIRHFLYDKKWLTSVRFNLPIISVGNLTVGGTGKSPMIEYIVELLQHEYKVAIISRGYKRRTKGYVLADDETTALEIGDEPMQFKLHFPTVPVAVCERRIEAIPQLLQDCPDTSVVLLDDAFQHREIEPSFSILLTDFNNLFTRDLPLPTGDLRDLRFAYRRADLVIVTKCPSDITEKQAEEIQKEINPLPHQHVLFATLEYESLYAMSDTNHKRKLNPETGVLLVTGIANPKPLKQKLQQQESGYEYLSFPDHHIFTIDDLRSIRKRFEQLKEIDKLILTTEKDAVRLFKFKEELNNLPVFVLPVRHRFLFDGDAKLRAQITKMLSNFHQQATLKETTH
jgi:tetraacyldisaccharide 4'-kinase